MHLLLFRDSIYLLVNRIWGDPPSWWKICEKIGKCYDVLTFLLQFSLQNFICSRVLSYDNYGEDGKQEICDFWVLFNDILRSVWHFFINNFNFPFYITFTYFKYLSLLVLKSVHCLVQILQVPTVGGLSQKLAINRTK